MNFYISDLHFGHDNILKYDGRPFNTTDEMTEVMIRNWNSVVKHNDTVYVLGDFAWKDSIGADVASQLNGKKILIKGNHDNRLGSSLRTCFASVHDYLTLMDNNIRLVLSHYPIAHWDRQYYDSILLYGHIHNSKEEDFFQEYLRNFSLYICKPINAFNVGCMQPYMNYTPRTLKELLSVRRG